MEMIKGRRLPLKQETIVTLPILDAEDLDLGSIIEKVADFIGDGILEINDGSEPKEYCECVDRCSKQEPLFRVSHPLFNGQVPEIERIIYNKPATIVFWKDGTKTIVKCSKADTYDPEIGFEKAILTKMFGRAGLRRLYKEYSAEKYAVEPLEEKKPKPVSKSKATSKSKKTTAVKRSEEKGE